MQEVVPRTHCTNDIVDAQKAGGCIIVCSDINARTAEQADYTRLVDLQGFVDVPKDGAYLGADVPRSTVVRRLPLQAVGEMSCWSLCRFTELLTVKRRTSGDAAGECSYTTPHAAKCSGLLPCVYTAIVISG